jgi:hypothetical protein
MSIKKAAKKILPKYLSDSIHKIIRPKINFNSPINFQLEENKISNYDECLNDEEKVKYLSTDAITRKLKIITAYDDAFKQIGDVASRSIRIYASIFGFDHQTYFNTKLDRPPAWAKIAHLINEIKSGTHEYILWVDADACFIRGDVNIMDSLSDEKDIYMVNHLCTRNSVKNMPGVYFQCERPNTGVLLVKSNKWSLEFLEAVWVQKDCINHEWWEQAAFHKLMGYFYEISHGERINKLNEDVMSHIGWLDNSWNSVPTKSSITQNEIVTNSIAPSVIHFAGINNNERLKMMKNLRFNEFSLVGLANGEK